MLFLFHSRSLELISTCFLFIFPTSSFLCILVLGGGVKFSHRSLSQWVQCGELIFCFSLFRLIFLLLRNMWERRRNIVLERKTKLSAPKSFKRNQRNPSQRWRRVENRKHVAFRSRLREGDKKNTEHYGGDYSWLENVFLYLNNIIPFSKSIKFCRLFTIVHPATKKCFLRLYREHFLNWN